MTTEDKRAAPTSGAGDALQVLPSYALDGFARHVTTDAELCAAVRDGLRQSMIAEVTVLPVGQKPRVVNEDTIRQAALEEAAAMFEHHERDRCANYPDEADRVQWCSLAADFVRSLLRPGAAGSPSKDGPGSTPGGRAILSPHDMARAGRPADKRALGLATGFSCYRKFAPAGCGCDTYCAALRDGIEHHLHDVVPASEVRRKALADAADLCERMEGLQEDCTAQWCAAAIRALITHPEIAPIVQGLRMNKEEAVKAAIRDGCEAHDRALYGSEKLVRSRTIEAGIRAALDSFIRSMGDEGWRDIASAPKDGTNILVYTERRVVRVAYFEPGGCGDWRSLPGYLFERPTHWQPLPLPPAPKVSP